MEVTLTTSGTEKAVGITDIDFLIISFNVVISTVTEYTSFHIQSPCIYFTNSSYR